MTVEVVASIATMVAALIPQPISARGHGWDSPCSPWARPGCGGCPAQRRGTQPVVSRLLLDGTLSACGAGWSQKRYEDSASTHRGSVGQVPSSFRRLAHRRNGQGKSRKDLRTVVDAC